MAEEGAVTKHTPKPTGEAPKAFQEVDSYGDETPIEKPTPESKPPVRVRITTIPTYVPKEKNVK
jgi:hypothetical protein